MNIVLIGYGNVGKNLLDILRSNGKQIGAIVRSSGIYDVNSNRLDNRDNFHRYINQKTVVFISTPSQGRGETTENYYRKTLETGAKIVTCEKAFLAYNWKSVEKRLKQIKYSASVGGNAGILGAITKFEHPINKIWGVLNGTLNYIGDKLIDKADKEKIFKDVIEKGFAEPGAKTLSEIITQELQDLTYKTTILANHAKIFDQIITPEDFVVIPETPGHRCSVSIENGIIRSGFIEPETSDRLPKGVNNCLYINDRKVAEGPGTGGKETAERMYEDFLELQEN